MKDIVPILKETTNNNELFFIGMIFLFFVLLIKLVFFKRYFALLKIKHYIEIKQNSAVFLFFILILFSCCLVYFFLFIAKPNDLSLVILPTFLVLTLTMFFVFIIQSFLYVIIWSIFEFKPGSLEELFNIISFVKTWKLIVFVLSFFFFYFAKIPSVWVFYVAISLFSLLFIFYFSLLIHKMKNQNILIFHGILYLFVLEVFPLLFMYHLFETW